MKIKEAKEIRRMHEGRETKLFFPSDVDEDITLVEFNEKFGTPGWVYCDTLEPINPYNPLIRKKEEKN